MNLTEEFRLCGELVALRIQVSILKDEGAHANVIRDHEMRALQVALQLKATCEARLQ